MITLHKEIKVEVSPLEKLRAYKDEIFVEIMEGIENLKECKEAGYSIELITMIQVRLDKNWTSWFAVCNCIDLVK